MPNMQETLFFALLVVYNAPSASAANEWACSVVDAVPVALPAWPPAGDGWRDRGSKPAPLYEPLCTAYARRWDGHELEKLCVAMQ
eukprot:3963574-Prymnesium_polylepis.1